MSQTVPKLVGQSGAQQLMRRLDRLKHEWPSEPGLHDLEPSTVSALLEDIAANHKARPLALWPAAILLGLFTVLAASMSLLAAAYPFGLLLLVMGVAIFEPRGAERTATYALTQTNDVHVLSALIQATRYRWGQHLHIKAAINRLLEQVTEEHIGLLSQPVQRRLWNYAVEPVLRRCNSAR